MNSTARFSPTSQGIIMMAGAVLCWTCIDVVVKALSGDYHVMQLLWVRYAGQAAIAVSLAALRDPGAFRSVNPPLQLVRALFLLFATFTFFTGLGRVELAAATAIVQVNPLMIVFVAWFVLGESLGWRKLAGVFVGLAGTFAIIRPGTEVFDPNVLYPLAAAAGYAGYTIMTRLLSRHESVWTNFTYTSVIGFALSTMLVPFFWTAPDGRDLAVMLLGAGFGACGQYLVVRALFVAEAGVVAPITYVSLVFAALFGAVFFGEYPDAWTYAGSAMIALSGIWIWRQESRGGLGAK